MVYAILLGCSEYLPGPRRQSNADDAEKTGVKASLIRDMPSEQDRWREMVENVSRISPAKRR
jgi:hypothetical protein